MISPANTLLCIYSYNMGRELETLIQSTKLLCPGFPLIIIDDASENPETHRVVARNRDCFRDVLGTNDPKAGKRHGNLYLNIQRSFEYAAANGFEYLFMIQDDMQFVRPFSEDVRSQYTMLFNSDENVVQVDPRFLRRGGDYEVLIDRRAYRYSAQTSYADVGITHVGRLSAIQWRFQEGERRNRDALTALGKQRLFPFTPIITHVPFPRTFRKGRRKFSLLPVNRGRYCYHYMSESEMTVMDSRPITEYPHFRTYLRPKNMLVGRLFYEMRKDTKVFN